MNPTIVDFLTSCPVSDINFKTSLLKANEAQLQEALGHFNGSLNGSIGKKTAIKAISSRLNKLRKQCQSKWNLTARQRELLDDLDDNPDGFEIDGGFSGHTVRTAKTLQKRGMMQIDADNFVTWDDEFYADWTRFQDGSERES